MKQLFINLETIPDIEGARMLYDLPESLNNKDVGKVLFHHHVNDQGRDERYLRPRESIVAVVSMISMHDEEVKYSSVDLENTSEKKILALLGDQFRQHMYTFCWDEGRELNSLLHIRCMIHELQLAERPLRTVERRIRTQPGSVSLALMAKRFGFQALPMPGDEESWKDFRAHGFYVLRNRCKTNLIASAQLGLRHLYTTAEIDNDLYRSLSNSVRAL